MMFRVKKQHYLVEKDVCACRNGLRMTLAKKPTWGNAMPGHKKQANPRISTCTNVFFYQNRQKICAEGR